MKPHPHNKPFEVTPELEQAFLEQLAARDESDAEALERQYGHREWLNQWLEEGREAFQRSQGIVA